MFVLFMRGGSKNIFVGMGAGSLISVARTGRGFSGITELISRGNSTIVLGGGVPHCLVIRFDRTRGRRVTISRSIVSVSGELVTGGGGACRILTG